MGKYLYTPPEKVQPMIHFCYQPSLTKSQIGTIWECSCGQRWRLNRDFLLVCSWRRISKWRSNRILKKHNG